MEKIKKPELIVIANDDCSFANKDQSLQGGFKNFRSYINAHRKKKEAKMREAIRMQEAFTEKIKAMQKPNAFASFKAYYKNNNLSKFN